MADIGITKFRVQIPRGGATPSTPGFAQSEGQDPVNPPGSPTGIYVPYLGATGEVNLGEFGLSTGYVTFDTTPTGTPATQGTTYWDDSKSTVALIMNGTTQHIGQDQFVYVKNSTGSPIAKGVAVRNSGTDGGSGHILIEPMLANGTNASETFLGVTAEAIANGSFGQVMSFGELAGINTSTYTAGAFLYVSTTVAGQFQTTAPVAPNNIILVGRAINSKNNGDIFIRPTIGSNINNDEGVKITSPATGDLLQRQSNGLFENRTLSQVIGTAYVPSTRTLTINGTAFDLSANRSWSVGTVTDVTAGTGIAVFPNPTSATPQVALTGQALSFHSLSGTGFVYRTSGIVGVRTLTAGTGITITNGDGVSGNPTISVNFATPAYSENSTETVYNILDTGLTTMVDFTSLNLTGVSSMDIYSIMYINQASGAMADRVFKVATKINATNNYNETGGNIISTQAITNEELIIKTNIKIVSSSELKITTEMIFKFSGVYSLVAVNSSTVTGLSLTLSNVSVGLSAYVDDSTPQMTATNRFTKITRW